MAGRLQQRLRAQASHILNSEQLTVYNEIQQWQKEMRDQNGGFSAVSMPLGAAVQGDVVNYATGPVVMPPSSQAPSSVSRRLRPLRRRRTDRMTGSDEQQIRDLVATWMSATRAGDIDTVLSLMTDDVVFLVAGQPPFGKQKFAAAMRAPAGVADAADRRPQRNPGNPRARRLGLHVDTTQRGGHACPAAAAPTKRAGHTLSILRRQRPLAAGARRQPAHAGQLP